jgi:anti-sigma B factor antagonist
VRLPDPRFDRDRVPAGAVRLTLLMVVTPGGYPRPSDRKRLEVEVKADPWAGFAFRSPGENVPVEAGLGELGSRHDHDEDDRGPIDNGFLVTTWWPTPSTAVLRPEGELDLASASDLRHELFTVIEGGADAVVVDLETTTFIDSMTIGVLLGAVRRLQQHGGELRIACADPNIRRIFEITLLDRVFAIHPSCEAALGRSAGDTSPN